MMAAGELIIQASIQILNVFNPVLAVPAAVGMSIWQRQNVESFRQHVEFVLKELSQRKLDRADTESDEFKELIMRVTREAGETSSRLKRQVLARALVNSAFMPKGGFQGKLMLLRVLGQISEEEISILSAIHHLRKQDVYKHVSTHDGATEGVLMDYVGVSKEDLAVTIYGLRQLSMISVPMNGTFGDEHGEKYALSPLADRLVEWCTIEEHG
jgi:hypothetical protein